MPPKILVIVGPTASGKTRMAVELAQRHNGEVISADSMQIYRTMDIGTAKPTKEEMGGIPHPHDRRGRPGGGLLRGPVRGDGRPVCGRRAGAGQAAHCGRWNRAVHRLPAVRTHLCPLLPRQRPAG